MTTSEQCDIPHASPQPRPTASLGRLFSLPDFRLLVGGTSTSLLGDQFALIATPWLALQLTNDPLILGLVLALEGVPRAAFMIIGGAFADRVSPRRVMLLCDVARAALTAAMAALMLFSAIHVWMICVFALAFGTLAGVAMPAENSIVPRLVDRNDLQAGNAVIMGVSQLARFVGPAAAGALIALYSDWTTGIATAYAIDAGTFLLSAVTFILMSDQKAAPSRGSGLASFGAVIASLGLVTHLGLDALLLGALGIGNGYLGIILFTWIQARTPEVLLGRVMSLVTFASLGLVSLSQAGAGAFARWDLDALFIGSGALVIVATVWGMTRPERSAFTQSLAGPSNTAAHHENPQHESERYQ